MGIGSIGNAIDQTFTVMKDAMKGATSAVRRTFEQLEVELAKIEKTASEEKKERIQLVRDALKGFKQMSPAALLGLIYDNGLQNDLSEIVAQLSKPNEGPKNDDNAAQAGSIDGQVSDLSGNNDSQVNWIG
jgi:hypothetical protein